MTDYSGLASDLGPILAASVIMGGTFLVLYLMDLSERRAKKNYLESYTKIIGERRILAESLYKDGRGDKEVENALDKILPLPKKS